MLLLLLACTQPANDLDHEGIKTGPGAEDGFGDHASVRINEPYEGQSVESSVTIRFDFGDAVAFVQALSGDSSVTGLVAPGKGTLTVDLPIGRQRLVLVGFDAQRQEISRDEVVIQVREEEAGSSWVGISTPSDGAHPMNPVVFSADGEGLTRIEFLADDWSIGEIAPGGTLSYSFGGVGFERRIEALGYDGDTLVASDVITITVEESTVDPGPTDFNELVIDLVDAYPKDGTYTYYWPSDGGTWSGSTRDQIYQGQKVTSHGGFSACYCSGITFEWYLRAYQEWDKANGGDGNDLNGIDDSDIWVFRRDWYVRDIRGPGPSVAMENYGVGTDVGAFENWRQGDFVQLWRKNGSGHTVVFWDWIEDDDGNLIGMEYASCQNATDGLGLNDEYFGSSSGSLDPQYMWAARGWLADLWY